MNSKIDAQESSFDVVKFLIALSVVVVSLSDSITMPMLLSCLGCSES